MYAKIENNNIIQYPFTLEQFKASYPNTSFPVNISDQELVEYGVVRVIATGQPVYDRLTQNCVEVNPFYVNNRWEQQWSVVQASLEEIAKRKESIKADIIAQTQQRLDLFSQTKGYDNILSCCTYATDPIQKFAQEGQYCVQARSATWAQLFQIFEDIDNELRPFPQSYQDIESELPQLQWPV